MNHEHHIDGGFTDDRRGLSRRRATGPAVAAFAGVLMAGAGASPPVHASGGSATTVTQSPTQATVNKVGDSHAPRMVQSNARLFWSVNRIRTTGTSTPAVLVTLKVSWADCTTGTVCTVKKWRLFGAADFTCRIPETLDQWSRRLIAVQFCSKAQIVPADLPTLLPYDEPVPQAVGHCGHHVLHQTPTTSDLPVSAWYTPTSC